MKHLFLLFLVTLTMSAPGQVPGDTLDLDSSYAANPGNPYTVGMTLPTLTLKNRSGQFRTIPAQGNYCLIIMSSPSCQQWNSQAGLIDAWLSNYPYVDPYFILTVEAHPDTLPGQTWQKYRHGSAYAHGFPPVWWTDWSLPGNVRLNNPWTYGERQAHADTITARWNPLPQILIDDPHNTAWKMFGNQPAIMWLTGPAGEVLAAAPMFNFMPSQGEPTRHALDDALSVATGIAKPVGDDVHLIEFDGYRWERVTERKGSRMYKGVGR